MSNSIREHMLKSLAEGIRFDGRKLDEFRPVSVETGISMNAEGSARVSIGGTVVLAGVKMGVETPYPDTPESGNLMVNAELLPLSDPEFEAGPPSETAIEVARITDRGIRESKSLDLKKLCITPKEKVWSVMIDAVSMNSEGNMIDAAALASIAAVQNARMPKYENGSVKYDQLTETKLPVSQLPITISIIKIGPHLLVDPTKDEEAVADARLSAAVMPDGRLCAMQKGGDAPLSIQEIDEMLKLVEAKSVELRKHVEAKA
jgi:exosome complex component RRP42